jgi:hypothetical protein
VHADGFWTLTENRSDYPKSVLAPTRLELPRAGLAKALVSVGVMARGVADRRIEQMVEAEAGAR